MRDIRPAPSPAYREYRKGACHEKEALPARPGYRHHRGRDGRSGGAAYAVTSVSAVNVTGLDHERITFTLAPGASQAFKLPASNDPVRIDLDKVSTNGGVQTPSEVFSALVNVDKNGAGMSWIGTNSDGSQSAGSTAHGSTVTTLVCGASCVIATLSVSSVAAHTVVLKANAATSIISEQYVINIWF